MVGQWVSNDGKASARVWEGGGCDKMGKPQYRYELVVNGEAVYEGDDMYGPAFGGATVDRMLATLASFLGAWQEGREYDRRHGEGSSDHGDLFPPEAEPFIPWIEEFSCDCQDE